MANIKEVSLTINNENCIQENFRGAGGVYHAYTYRADFPDKEYTEQERNIELQRVKDMELKIARTYFDLVAYKDGKWDWDCDEMLALYKWLSKMQEFGVEVQDKAGITVILLAILLLKNKVFNGISFSMILGVSV